MKKEGRKINNRLLYSLISVFLLILISGGIYATINPATDAYHNIDKINFTQGFSASSIKLTGNYQAIWGSWNNPLWLEEANHAAIVYNDPTSNKGFMIGFHGLNDKTYFAHTTNSWSTGAYLGVIDGAGNVGIGTESPAYKLQVEGSINADEFLYDSDISLKENILPLEDSLYKLQQLKGISFNWKKDGRESIGLIAQDVEKVLPQIVQTNNEGLKSVEYGNIVALLIEGMKEQQAEIESLQREIEELKSQLAE